MRTFIKWSGNKSKYINKIVKHFPTDFNTYIEPFIGSGAVFLHSKPSRWIINDMNRDLINVWRNIQENHKQLEKQIKNILVKILQEKDKATKLQQSRKFTTELTELEFNVKRAALFLVLKNLVYMGILLRHNQYYFRGFDMSFYDSKGLYFGSNRYKQNLEEVHDFLNNSKGRIMLGDYKKTLSKAKKGDFVFLDPPYIESKNYDFKYNIEGNVMAAKDNTILKELATQLKMLDERGVKWLMTQANTKEVLETFKGKYHISSFKVFRRQSKTHTKELIIKNY